MLLLLPQQKKVLAGDIGNAQIILRHSASVRALEKQNVQKCFCNFFQKNEEDQTIITLEEPVNQKFAVRYLNHFAKATPLSKTVRFHQTYQWSPSSNIKLKILGG